MNEIVKHDGEIIEPPIENPTEPEKRYTGASSAPVSPEAATILVRPFSPEELQILPTGELYPPQVQIRRRLTEAFGAGGWAMVPVSRPMVESEPRPHVAQVWQLWANGRFVAEAIGEQEFQIGTNRLSLATAAEGAKSNGLMRCVKDLGIGSECWDRDFCEAWKRDHAEQYSSQNGKRYWRKKGEKTVSQPAAAPPRPRPTHHDAEWVDQVGGVEPLDTGSTGFPEGVIIKSIKEKEWTNPKGEVIPFWVIIFEDGREASTFSRSVSASALTFKASGTPVDPIMEATKKGFKLTSLEPVKM